MIIDKHVLMRIISQTENGTMEGGFTTTYATIAYPHNSCELQSRPWRGVLDTTLCVVNDLRQVAGFLRFPPIIKVTATI